MVSKKRNLEDDTSLKAKKKSKLAAEASTDKKQKRDKAKVKADKRLETTSNIVSEEIDFPRGGGTTFTPQEVKTIRAEAMTEADDLFKVRVQYVVFMLSPLICCVKGTRAEVKKVRQKVGCQE
jgi:rRNA biogenesis protein RRP5